MQPKGKPGGSGARAATHLSSTGDASPAGKMAALTRGKMPGNDSGRTGTPYFDKSGTDFLASAVTSASSVAVRLKKKSRKARDKRKDKRSKLWRQYVESRDRKGPGFDSPSWLHDHHDPKGKIAYRKKKAAARARRRKPPPPSLPPQKEQKFEYATMTPFLKMPDVRKRPKPALLLPLPTPMGRTNYEAIMGRYENFQEAMHGLHEKIVTKRVSKDFFRFVLDQEQRMRAAKIREAEEAKENERKLKRALARLKNKKLAAAFGTWEEVWDTMKRMRNLMRRVAGGTLSARFMRWQEFTKSSVRDRMDSFNNLAEYAIVIQSWTRMWQGVEYFYRFRRETGAARCIQRMVMAHNCRNILARYHRQKVREAELRRKCMNRLVRGCQMRVFAAWADWAYSVGRLRAFVKKHMLAGISKALHAWIEATGVLREERENMAKLQAFMRKHMLGGVRKGFVA